MRRQRFFLICAALALVLLCTGPKEDPPVAADAQAAIEEEAKYIALTFDDGPRRVTTTRLLDGLRERGASATFFLIGEQIDANQDLVERMKAEGHQVGNHTWGHVRLQGAEAGDILWELQETDACIREVLGEGEYWIRPPYGLIDQEDRKLITVPMVHWSIDSRDWEFKNADKVTRMVLKEAKPGSIILMHDIYPTSVDAALRIVDALQAEGYWFVTVEELFALSGVEAQPGELYSSVNTVR